MNGALPSFAKSGPLGTVNELSSADESSMAFDSSESNRFAGESFLRGRDFGPEDLRLRNSSDAMNSHIWRPSGICAAGAVHRLNLNLNGAIFHCLINGHLCPVHVIQRPPVRVEGAPDSDQDIDFLYFRLNERFNGSEWTKSGSGRVPPPPLRSVQNESSDKSPSLDTLRGDL